MENNQVQIREYINQLKISKSMDPDRVYSQTLKELAGVIVMSLLTIFDGSFQQEEVSTDWRKVNITHVLKKGNKEVTSGTEG